MEYQKINTLFKRDSNNIIIPEEYTLEEFVYLKDCKFECTEKIDGTNIRIELDSTSEEITMEFKGRTDHADIPKHLLNKLNELFNKEKLIEIFNLKEKKTKITIYGEGYGMKIQKGGNYISNDVNFILFDIKIDNWYI